MKVLIFVFLHPSVRSSFWSQYSSKFWLSYVFPNSYCYTKYLCFILPFQLIRSDGRHVGNDETICTDVQDILFWRSTLNRPISVRVLITYFHYECDSSDLR
jgi:hypothetical protein